MRVLPLGVDEFPEMRSDPRSLYVDKTQLISDLCTRLLRQQPQIFLSRPRRFGKTLLVSTLEALFQGQRDLFRGTWIGQEGHWDWKAHQYPVLRLNMAVRTARTPERLEKALVQRFSHAAYRLHLNIDDMPEADIFLERIIVAAYRQYQRKVTVLIDEYDAPITSNMGRAEVLEEILSLMRGVYGVLKDTRMYTRCTFMTGITRLANAGLFSGANHFNDVSLRPAFNALMGFTEREMRTVPDLALNVERCARNAGCSVQAVRSALRKQYDGYQFSAKNQRVYNPYSVAKCFEEFNEQDGMPQRLSRMPRAWSHSGTPNLLFRLWRHNPKSFVDAGRRDVLEFLDYAKLDAAHPDMTALLYQAGYLTLVPDGKASDPDGLRLDFPNQEVKQAYIDHLMDWQGNEVSAWHADAVSHDLPGAFPVRDALLAGRADAFLSSLDRHLQRFPYPIHAVPRELKPEYDYESHYRKILYSTLAAVGMRVQAEVPTLRGRIDVLVESDSQIICLECKTDRDPVQALRQAWHKGYVDPYRASGKSVSVFGLCFTAEGRTVSAVAAHALGSYERQRDRWAREPFAQPEHTLTRLSRMHDAERQRIVDTWTLPDAD